MSSLWPEPLTPVEWGLPAKFRRWRPNQWKAVMRGVHAVTRGLGQVQPTGSGKSLTEIAQALFLGERSAFLTATKGLQKQLMGDFSESMGLVNIMGKANYECPHHGDCNKGHAARCKLRGSANCGYSNAHHRALSARMVVTNYSYWIKNYQHGKGLGNFGALFLDEAHHAPDELAAALQVSFSFSAVHELLGIDFPADPKNLSHWKTWGEVNLADVKETYESLKRRMEIDPAPSAARIRELLAVKNLVRSIQMVSEIHVQDWVVESRDWGFTLDPINPGMYAESHLFLGTPNIRLVSATMRRKTLHLLGLNEKAKENRRACGFEEYPSTFPPKRFPIMWIPTQKVDKSCKTDSDYREWLRRIDEIIGARLDRKGIIHTVSFDRRDMLLMNSRYADLMDTNFRDDITDEIVEKFKAAAAPRVLVSPSISTGYDFPYETCEYQIIGKIPFPDSRAKIVKAREERDRMYSPYVAMQQLVQAAGRGMRAEDDQCEVFIIDDHAEWFLRAFRALAPEWFYKSLRFIKELPKPPVALRRRKVA